MGFANNIRNINFGIITLIISLFLLVNVAIFFGSLSAQYERIIMTYLVITSFVFAFPDTRSKLFNANFITSMPIFLAAILISFIVGTSLGIIFTGNTMTQYIQSLNIGLLLAQSFIIAVAEESLFRQFLNVKIGVIASSVLFALFHYYVYDGNVIKFAIAFAFGITLSYIRKAMGGDNDPQGKGLVAAIGIHSGWNLAQYI